MSRRAPPQLSLFEATEPGLSTPLPPAAEATRELASTLPPELRLGTSSWTFPGWRGIVWPDRPSEARLAREGLTTYGRHPLLRTVGIDRTFYRPVEAAVLAAYAAQVPGAFRFLVKAHEACTVARFPDHVRYGARRRQENPLFLDPAYATEEVVGPAVEGLGGKLGTILFQLPPQPPGALDSFADRLHAFLRALPRGPLYAVELRNGSLFGPRYLQALADVGAVHCFNVHPGMISLQEQLRRFDPAYEPLADERSWSTLARSASEGGSPLPTEPIPPQALAGPAVVVRWMLHEGLDYQSASARYRPFSALVDEDPATRAVIAQLALAAARQGLPTLVVINNKAEGSAPLSIAALARAIADHQMGGQR